MKRKTPEGSVSDAIKKFMAQRNWRSYRQMSGKLKKSYGGQTRWMVVGEKGMPDLRFERVLAPGGFTLTVYVEAKSASGRLRDEQVTWIEEGRRRGAIVIVAGSIEEFESHYRHAFAWLHDGPVADAVIRSLKAITAELEVMTPAAPVVRRKFASVQGGLF